MPKINTSFLSILLLVCACDQPLTQEPLSQGQVSESRPTPRALPQSSISTQETGPINIDRLVSEYQKSLDERYNVKLPSLTFAIKDKMHPYLHAGLSAEIAFWLRRDQETYVIVPMLKIVRENIRATQLKEMLEEDFNDDVSIFIAALARNSVFDHLKMSNAGAAAVEEERNLNNLSIQLGKVALRKMDALSQIGAETLATRLTIGELLALPAYQTLILGGVDMTDVFAKKSLRKSLSNELSTRNKTKSELLVPEFRDPVRKLLVTRDLRLENGAKFLRNNFGHLFQGMKGGVPKLSIQEEAIQVLGHTKADQLMSVLPDELVRPQQYSLRHLKNVLSNWEDDDISAAVKMFETKASAAGKVMFLGGASGAGKSSGLRNAGFDDRDAISPDPIKAFFVNKSNPTRVNMSSGQLHANASAINGVLREMVNRDYSRCYVADATLADLDDVMDALQAGKKTVIEFHIVPPEMSFLRVLRRTPGGNDPTLPMDKLVAIYKGTMDSVSKLQSMVRSKEWQDQLRVNYYGPKFIGNEIGDNPLNMNIPWTAEEAEERSKLFMKRLDFLITQDPTIKSLLGDENVKPYFMDKSEWRLTLGNEFVKQYLDLPIQKALLRHSLRTK